MARLVINAAFNSGNSGGPLIDVETGEVKVVRIGSACDMGKVINPKIAEGQVEGSVGMGIGEALYEEIVLDKGVVVNTSFMDYQIPTTMDMPSVENSKTMIVEYVVPGAQGLFGAKGVGEAPLVAMSPAIAIAVYNAVGVRIKDLPLSKGKVLEGIKNARKG